MLWTEKYRPKHLDEIIGQDKFVDDALSWEDGMPNVLLYGVAGIGKTAAAGALANHILDGNKDGNFFEINASDDRRLEVVRTTIKEIATAMKVGDVPHKIVLLDEMDGMTPDAQNALKRIMERYSHNIRFIVTCNNRHKIITPLQSRCANYLFEKVSNEDIKIVLEKILRKEGITSVSQDDLEMFISAIGGDLRRAITELQASVASNTPLTIQITRMMEPYDDLLNLILEKKYELALSKTTELLALSVDMKTICIHLHDSITMGRGKDLGPLVKFKLLRIVGETEWRSNNMTPKLLAGWMIGQMI
tara:strand:+ start:1490 stop:2404 length:915 start_codon:yes stop_codon:yes gene_type:complete